MIGNIKWYKPATILVLISLSVSSCIKDPGIEETGVRLMFINTSPDANTIQVTLNGAKAYTPALSYNDTTGYLSFAGGTYNVGVENAGKAVTNTVIDFMPKSSYSIFMADSAKRISMLVYRDDLSLPIEPLRMKFRFLNFIPNSGTLSLAGISLPDTVLLTGSRAFEANNYTEARQAFQTYNSNQYELLLVSGNTIIYRLPPLLLSNNKIYTIYAHGIIGAAARPPQLSVIRHN